MSAPPVTFDPSGSEVWSSCCNKSEIWTESKLSLVQLTNSSEFMASKFVLSLLKVIRGVSALLATSVSTFLSCTGLRRVLSVEEDGLEAVNYFKIFQCK